MSRDLRHRARRARWTGAPSDAGLAHALDVQALLARLDASACADAAGAAAEIRRLREANRALNRRAGALEAPWQSAMDLDVRPDARGCLEGMRRMTSALEILLRTPVCGTVARDGNRREGDRT